MLCKAECNVMSQIEGPTANHFTIIPNNISQYKERPDYNCVENLFLHTLIWMITDSVIAGEDISTTLFVVQVDLQSEFLRTTQCRTLRLQNVDVSGEVF